MLTPLNPLVLQQWIDENRHLLKPPIGNKVIWPDGDFIVMVVGGPNARTDYHYNSTPEFFYQVEGEMVLKIKDNDTFRDIRIKAGEVFLLPGGVPHSPQRIAGGVGLVIEQKRPEGAKDGLQWYCAECGTKLYEEYFELNNIENQFGPVFERFYSSPEHRTCSSCGWQMPPRTL